MDAIKDIIRDLRTAAYAEGDGGIGLSDLADEIEAATKFVTSVAERADRDLAELNAENARLRAALKPVLECDCWILDTGKSCATDGGVDAIKAVRECQRILNGSETKR